MPNPVQQAVAPRVEALAEPLARSLGLELVDVEYLREGPSWILRIFIDKAPGVSGGITLDDCTALSRALAPALDVEEIIGTAYSLEVSSPGLERPLKKPADFTRFAGKRIKVKTYAPLPNAGPNAGQVAGPAQKNFQGVLIGMEGDKVALESDGKPLHIPLAAIAKAHLVAEL